MALNDVMDLLKSVAHNDEAYEYGNAMVQHISVVRYRKTISRKIRILIHTSIVHPIGGQYSSQKHWHFGWQLDAQACSSIFSFGLILNAGSPWS